MVRRRVVGGVVKEVAKGTAKETDVALEEEEEEEAVEAEEEESFLWETMDRVALS